MVNQDLQCEPKNFWFKRSLCRVLLVLVANLNVARDNFLDKILFKYLDFIKSFFLKKNSFIIFIVILSITFFTIIIYLLVDDLLNINIK